jgi:hypothetical protein
MRTSTTQAFALIFYNMYKIYKLLFNTCGGVQKKKRADKDTKKQCEGIPIHQSQFFTQI